MAPTLVPHRMSIFGGAPSMRVSSSKMYQSTPTSYAPRAPPPERIIATRRLPAVVVVVARHAGLGGSGLGCSSAAASSPRIDGQRMGVVSKRAAFEGRWAKSLRMPSVAHGVAAAPARSRPRAGGRSGACGEPARLSASAHSDADLEPVLAPLQVLDRAERGGRDERRRVHLAEVDARRRLDAPSRRSGTTTSAISSARVARRERVLDGLPGLAPRPREHARARRSRASGRRHSASRR